MNAALVGLIAHLIQMSRMGRLVGHWHAGIGAIYMLHSVTSDTTYLDPYMQVRGKFLDEMLRYLVSKGVELVSLDGAMQRLAQVSSRPFVCFTFDDGYCDNLTVALPVFRRWNCPFTIYVTTALVERRMPYTWGCLRELIQNNGEITIDAVGLRLRSESAAEKRNCYYKISKIIEAGDLDDVACSEMFRLHGVYAEEVQAKDALTETDLRTLAGDSLVEIGGHTDSHRRLSVLGRDEARADIQKNKAFLENIVQRPVRHFAFPYGDAQSCGPRDFDLASEIGFQTAVTTRLGGLFPSHLMTPTAWPRLHFRGSLENRSFMECQRNGSIAALLSLLGPVDLIDERGTVPPTVSRTPD